jgi:hypothetical protein
VTNLPNPNDVGPMTSNDLRCPECSAHVPPGADWCALCFADLRPPPPPEEPAAIEPGPDPEPVLAQAEAAPPVQRGGKHSRSVATGAGGDAVSDTAPDAVDEPSMVGRLPDLGGPRDAAAIAEFDARATEMLAQLAAAESSRPLGPLAARLESNGSRMVAAGFGVSVLIMATLLVMSVLGHFV